ncbi:MAG: bifunctional diaminohydroxyphosphoribosylaminopyrimidine deaminase/5-amino-6-(5-phosphoribosylamino)uracil reductase RibD [Actinomycetota bacterium]|nr:bifunctional diaminohydroxyphosphoribosylaminopyrimidine deaminase/5-amino-6-(5-phosphoribosylamino)uracil reductase RibD [Actinomycetota bacterium]
MAERHSGAAASSASPTAAELEALGRAVQLAANGAGTALPNPVVGCVLLDAAGRIVGEGYHAQVGGPHAEVVALRAAAESARGATAVVTLEPCNHTGRTGACSQALIDAGVARVIVAVRDPWPPAAGGIERLVAADVDVVDLSEQPLSADARLVNRVWLTATRLRRPFVTFKAGMTIDGRVAAADGTSRWITSAESRADVHRLRSEVDTMMVGVGTVLADDPQLTARSAVGAAMSHQPLRVVVDSTGKTPVGARVLDDAAETLIATTAEFGAVAIGVDLAALLAALYGRGKRHLLLEGGPRLAASMLDANLVDEVLIYLAPLLLGAGQPVLDGGSAATLAEARRFELTDVARFGTDLRVRWTR